MSFKTQRLAEWLKMTQLYAVYKKKKKNPHFKFNYTDSFKVKPYIMQKSRSGYINI